MQHPDAPRGADCDLVHGATVADPYRWLEDPRDRQTQVWLIGQREQYLRHREELTHVADWSKRVTAAVAAERSSAPHIRGPRAFFTRATRDAEYPTLYVSESGVDRVLIDPLSIDPSGNTVFEAWQVSVEGDLVAYQVSQQGDEDCSLFVQDVTTGRVIDGPITRVRRTAVAWLPGGDSFYFVRRLPPELHPGEELYHRRVYLHRLGVDPAEDVLIFGEGRAATQFYTVAVTPDGRWLTISSTAGSAPSNELWLADLRESDPAHPRLRPIHAEGTARTYTRIAPKTSPDDQMWLRTTLAAPRGRVVATTPADPGPETWRTVIPERADAVLRDFLPLTSAALPRPVALATWLHHAVSRITVHDLRDGSELGAVTLPGLGSIGPLRTHPGPSHEVWFSYTDHTTPPTVLRLDVREDKLQATSAARSGQPACQVVLETATSHDGTPVRVFVISPTGEPDRPRPTILTGYGGFGAPMTPVYSPDINAWVQAGGVFVVACLRGGGEEGVAWHRAGMGRHKQRVFDDFDAVTNHLVEQGWTTHRKLGILGNSNGGLLVAAALTQHPEKYGAATCLVPLTDMVRYERSGMGPSWRTEYGTVDDPDDFAALFAYSPYHHVRPGVAYPPVLMGSFDADSRVDPAHAHKFTAALQHASTGPVILRTEENVGHGNRAASRLLGLHTDVLAFFSNYLGLCPQEGLCEGCSAR